MQSFKLTYAFITSYLCNIFYTNMSNCIEDIHQFPEFNGEKEDFQLFEKRISPIYKNKIRDALQHIKFNKELYDSRLKKYVSISWFSRESQPADPLMFSVDAFIKTFELWVMHMTYTEYQGLYK